MLTLHWYIFRELIKTFLLTVIATTALVTLAGGIFNVVRQDGITGTDIIPLLPMLVPSILPFTASISVLFAVTSVFGRLAADNEFVACKAAGINIHNLFLAPVILSLFVAIVAVITSNYIAPERIAAIRVYIKSNIHAMAKEWFETRGYIRLGKRYLVTARAIESHFKKSALVERGWDPDLEYFNVERPAFLQLDDDGEVERFVTADSGWIVFNTQVEPIEITAIVTNAREFSNGQVSHAELTTLGPISRELPIRDNPSLLSLNRLLVVLDQPWQYSELQKSFEQFKQLFLRRFTLGNTAKIIELAQTVHFERTDGTLINIQAEIFKSDERKRMRLRNVVVAITQDDSVRPNRITAPLGTLEVVSNQTGEPMLELRLSADQEHRVMLVRQGGTLESRPQYQDEHTISGLIIPEEILRLVNELDPKTVIGTKEPLVYDDEVIDQARSKMQVGAASLRREVVAIFHHRFGFAFSPLVTTLMGAVLGMMFRGSHVLAAFGLSAIPFALAFVLIFAGWPLAEKEGTELLGASIIWGGLTAVGLANLLLIRWGVRR